MPPLPSGSFALKGDFEQMLEGGDDEPCEHEGRERGGLRKQKRQDTGSQRKLLCRLRGKTGLCGCHREAEATLVLDIPGS